VSTGAFWLSSDVGLPGSAGSAYQAGRYGKRRLPMFSRYPAGTWMLLVQRQA
jgi:hypothetical protein